MKLEWSMASSSDSWQLARWNHRLIRDEGHRNAMDVGQLQKRMAAWLKGDYQAVIFGGGGEQVGYALYRPITNEIHLRHFFIIPERRRLGLGRAGLAVLRDEIWPQHARLTVDVLIRNEAGIAFWRAMGFRDYALTLEIVPENP